MSPRVAATPFFFFFQAEDGIRDVAVTGVQTCALPILETSRRSFQILSLLLFRARSAAHGNRNASRNSQHRSEEHTSELQSRLHLVCRLLLEIKKRTDCSVTCLMISCIFTGEQHRTHIG